MASHTHVRGLGIDVAGFVQSVGGEVALENVSRRALSDHERSHLGVLRGGEVLRSASSRVRGVCRLLGVCLRLVGLLSPSLPRGDEWCHGVLLQAPGELHRDLRPPAR